MDAGLQSSILVLMAGAYPVWLMGQPVLSVAMSLLAMVLFVYGFVHAAAGGRPPESTERA